MFFFCLKLQKMQQLSKIFLSFKSHVLDVLKPLPPRRKKISTVKENSKYLTCPITRALTNNGKYFVTV